MTFGSTGLNTTITGANVSFIDLNATFLTRSGDYCLDGSFPKSVPKLGIVGLVFWAADYNNLFDFQVTSAGRAQLFRKATGNWITVLDNTSAAVKTAPGSSNEVRVVAKDGLMDLYVNGQKIGAMRAQMPASGNLRFGFYFEIGSGTPDSPDARVFNLKDYSVNAAD